MLKTITEVRESFWESFPQYLPHYKKNKRQNDYICDIRMSFIDYVEHLRRDNQITEKLARRVTL